VQEQLGWFFKAPMTPAGGVPEHALHKQERVLLDWLLPSQSEPYPADETAAASDVRA
ncbi:MAG: Inositol-3-phosphate synthase, partial [Frankiales bacterium]|nr:Inositol-3-phosphate synthase [Frankiales bacterium]